MYSLQDALDNRDKWITWAEEYNSTLKAQVNFHEFVKRAWYHMEGPASPFIDGWYVGALCEHLEAVSRFEITKLIINCPPRTTKSSILSVLWPAWWWIQAPNIQFYYSSHSMSLTTRDSVKCRRLIESPWYQRQWGHIFTLLDDQNTKTKYENNRNGYRASTSINSGVTGHGGDVLVMDDPNNVSDAESDSVRNSVNDFLSGGWSTRVNNPKKNAMVLAQQRTHEMDASGYRIANDRDGEYIKLILPMEFESATRCKTIILPSTNGKVWEDPRQKEGELLCPERMGIKEVQSIKNSLVSEYRIAGQLQQRPAPAEGGLIRKKSFRPWKHEKMPTFTYIIQSWDTALNANEMDAYSACTTFGLFNDEFNIANLMLLGMYRGRIEYPDLRAMAQRLYKDYRYSKTVEIKPDGKHVPDMVLVEAKVSGISLIQDFRRMGISAIAFDPSQYGDKIARVRRVTDIIEAGRIWVPAMAPDFLVLKPFAHDLIEICSVFPNSDSRDVVDSMTQVLLRLKYGGYLTHPEDEYSKNSGTMKPSHGFYGVSD